MQYDNFKTIALQNAEIKNFEMQNLKNRTLKSRINWKNIFHKPLGNPHFFKDARRKHFLACQIEMNKLNSANF